MFSKLYYLIKLYPNEVEIFNLFTGRSVKRKSKLEFSSNRLIIADFQNLEMFLKELIKEILSFEPKKLFLSQAKIMFQVMDLYDGGLSKIELRVISEIGERIGGHKIIIIDGSVQITIEQALKDLQNLK